MTFRECIEQRRVIDVDLRPTRDVIWSGVWVKDNGQIAVCINYDEVRKRLDGFTVFRSKEINRYRLSAKSECRGTNQTSIADHWKRLNLRQMVDVPSSLRAAASESPIAFFTQDDTSSYFVGKLVSLRRDQARFRLIDKKGSFTRYRTITIHNIDFFSFGGEYERRLESRLKRNRSNHQATRLPGRRA
jgi:hypothetical protein